jgi:hypothetical protein
MMTDRAEEILEFLETDPAEKFKEKVVCEKCGSPDHIKVIPIIRRKGENKIRVKIRLCSSCRKDVHENKERK